MQVLFIALTMLLGSVFLGVKAKEYYDKYEECHIPGASFNAEGGLGCEKGNIAKGCADVTLHSFGTQHFPSPTHRRDLQIPAQVVYQESA